MRGGGSRAPLDHLRACCVGGINQRLPPACPSLPASCSRCPQNPLAKGGFGFLWGAEPVVPPGAWLLPAVGTLQRGPALGWGHPRQHSPLHPPQGLGSCWERGGGLVPCWVTRVGGHALARWAVAGPPHPSCCLAWRGPRGSGVLLCVWVPVPAHSRSRRGAAELPFAAGGHMAGGRARRAHRAIGSGRGAGLRWTGSGDWGGRERGWHRDGVQASRSAASRALTGRCPLPRAPRVPNSFNSWWWLIF